MSNQPNEGSDESMSPVDIWILSGHAFLQEKYNVKPSQYLEVESNGSTITVNTDCTQIGSWFAHEAWRQRTFLAERGIGLKVLTGGKVLGDLPPVED